MNENLLKTVCRLARKWSQQNENGRSGFLKTTAFALMLTFVSASFAQKQMENLNRGVLAVRTSTSEVLVSWRILGTEFSNASYNVYRGGALLNSSPITGASNYVDATSLNSTYTVAAVVNGVEQEQSDAADVWDTFYKSIPISAPAGGTTPDGVSYTYEANDASVGDLDGDGDYEIVLKWMPTNSKDNANAGYTGNTILQGLEMDGTVLWTIDLGRNIRSGAHYTQFMVYDLDGDGKAEVACKTADGTVDGQGNVIGSSSADYRNSGGYILSGPEYFCIFSGQTGATLVTNNYLPARGTVSDWGDSYGNRVDRFLACVAYLDGVRPSLVFCRGYYTRTVLVAWDYRNGNLTQRWTFDSDNGNSSYYGQGNHNLAVGDLDGDGKDEIQYGSCAIDHDGSGLYSTGFGHGDAGHLGDFNPNRSGLEFFMPHEEANGGSIPGIDFRDPNNGNVLWKVNASGDIGRGITADIDPNYIGAESWASDGSGIYSCTGTKISSTLPTTAGGGPTYNMCAWYDGDLSRELVDRHVITKWNASTGSTDRVLTAYNYDVTSNNSTKYNPCIIADIMGDWREEIIWRNSANTQLKIFTSNSPATERIFSLMHDPLYRTSIAWQNVGYNQPAHTSFYLGSGMSTPATPNIYLAGVAPDPGTVSLSATGEDGEVTLDWSLFNINSNLEIMRDTDSDPAGRSRIAVVAMSADGYTDTNVSNGTTYYYWVKTIGLDGNTVNSNAASATPSACVGTTIVPYHQVDGGSWSGATTISVNVGSTVHFGPQPVSGGSWSWSGPNGFSSTMRDPSVTNIQTGDAGDYVATYTNTSGCESTQTFTISVVSVSSDVWLEAECGNVGSSWDIVSDANASSDKYVTVQAGLNSTGSAPGSSGQISYNFDVTSGTYNLWARVITPNGTDDSFWVSIDGGSWFLWNNIGPNSNWAWEQCQSYNLSTGSHTLTVAYREDGAKLDKIYIGSSTPSGEGSEADNCVTITPTSITIQENETGFCSVDGSIDSNNAGFTGDGFANTSNATGNGVDWYVNFSNSDTYTFTFKYASSSDRPADLIIGGNTVASNISFPSTGSWTTWASVSVDASVSAGAHDVRLEATGTSGLGNIDYIMIEGATPLAIDCSLKSAQISDEVAGIGSNDLQPLAISPNPNATGLLNISASIASDSEVAVAVYSASGSVVLMQQFGLQESGLFNQTLNISDLEAGVYIVKLQSGSSVQTAKMIRK